MNKKNILEVCFELFQLRFLAVWKGVFVKDYEGIKEKWIVSIKYYFHILEIIIYTWNQLKLNISITFVFQSIHVFQYLVY